MDLTSVKQKLKGIVPDSVLAQLDEVCAKFGIDGPRRLSHFLSQCGHESGGFKAVVENLNYSEKGLLTTFRSDFDINKNRVIEAQESIKANKLARNPEAIANFVYANQNGNGNEASGDGWKFRGRGYIQLTGKANYEKFTKFIGEDCVANPDLVATKYPLASAAYFFMSNKLWTICDKGAADSVVLSVTKRVNGGTNGYDDRLARFKKIWSLIGK